MNEILEVDLKNMMVVVEPGVVTSEINEASQGARVCSTPDTR